MPSLLDSRCSACNHNYSPVPSDGPSPCPLLFLGEGPGKWENRHLCPFVGDAGQELNLQYLPIAGLSRPDVHVDNLHKCWTGPGNPTPTDEAALTCARHWLPMSVAEIKPEVIVTLGATAALICPGIDLKMHHGEPRQVSIDWLNWSGWLFPGYHPAAGFRDARFMIDIRHDFENLRLFLSGFSPTVADAFPNPQYSELTTIDEVDATIPNCRYLDCAVDTESTSIHTPEHPDSPGSGRIYSLSYSIEPGTGYFIDVRNIAAIRHLWSRLHELRAMWIFHAALHDLSQISQLSLSVPPRRFRDTMVRAYLLSTDQSLKVLAHRLCGMEMQDYNDLVMPYSEAMMMDFLQLAASITDLPGYVRVKRESDIRKRCRRIIDEVFTKNAKPIDRWLLLPEDRRRLIEAVIGLPPEAGVHQVPRPELIYYACRDSDATLRIDPILAKGMVNLRKSAA